jgi:hypothetical protein
MNQTFSPVVSYETVRVLIAIAAALGLDVDWMDATSAFTQVAIDRDIYMKQPPGFVDKKRPDYVCKLHTALYGLKQSSREWNTDVTTKLLDKGYTQLKTEACVFLDRDGKRCRLFMDVSADKRKWLIVAVYVDDFLIFSNDEDRKNDLKRYLKSSFRMSDFGTPESFIGLEISRAPSGAITLKQAKYTAEILERFRMDACNSVPTPYGAEVLSRKHCPATDNDLRHMATIPYREAVGALIHLARCTRPDIAERVRAVGRFSHNPGRQHWVAVKRIFRYLKGTTHLGLTYGAPGSLDRFCHKDAPKVGPPSSLELRGYADSDWATCPDSRRSVTGYVFFLNGGPVAWKSRTQPTVASHTSEAEYMAASDASKTAVALRNFLGELDLPQDTATIIFEDNNGCISMAKNERSSERSKHIDIRHHLIREYVKQGRIHLAKVASKENVADLLTKLVRPAALFLSLRDFMLGLSF